MRLMEPRPSSIAPVPFLKLQMPWRPQPYEPASTISMSPPSSRACARRSTNTISPRAKQASPSSPQWGSTAASPISSSPPRWVGRLAPVQLPPSEKNWEFGDSLGRQAMVEVPFSEIILIARHVKTAELHTHLNRIALGDVRDPTTPAPKAADATGRSPQRFVVDAVVTNDGNTRRITARGRDIYAFSAPLVCEVTARLLDGRCSSVGAQPPGAIFDAQEVLSALTPDHLSFEITSA